MFRMQGNKNRNSQGSWSSTGFEADGQPMSATAFRRVEYAGDDLPVTIYVNDIEEYIKGIYRVEVYTDAGLLGTTTFSLR